MKMPKLHTPIKAHEC